MRGIRNCEKRWILFKFCRERADLCLLQETHSCKEDETIWKNEWGGEIIFNHGEKNSRGVCILITKKCPVQVINRSKVHDGRLILCTLQNDRLFDVSLINIYAPNKDSPAFFDKLNSMLLEACPNKIIIGNFNLTLDIKMDRLETVQNNESAAAKLKDIMKNHLLTDVWRNRNEKIQIFSWFKNVKRGSSKASRIDYALISKGLDQKVENVTYIPASHTDHSAVFMSLSCDLNKRGKGYWKLNTTLLLHEEHKEEVRKTIQTCIEQCAEQQTDPSSTWEIIKARSAKCLKEISKNQSNINKVTISQLYEAIDELQSNMPLTQQDMKLLIDSQLDLESKLEAEIQSVIFKN